MWHQHAGLKRKFLATTIAAVIIVAIIGSAVVYWLLQNNPANAAIYLAGVTLFYIIVGISGILLITRLMVQPVVSLTAKVEDVRRGNLNVEIDTNSLRDSGDEMNQLIAGFAQMVRDLRDNIEALQHAKEKAEEYSEKLEQSNRRLTAIFDGLPDGVMIVDRNFRLVHVNPVIEKFMGKSLAQVRGEHCYEMCQGGPQCCSFCRADTVFQLGGRASTFCTKPAFAGQEDRILEIYDFPLYNEKGETDQVIEYVKDVTQAVQMQQQLERTQRLAEIGNMAAIVAHEVRNPLNAILGAVHYLQGERLDDGPGLGNRDPEEFFKPFFTTKLQGTGLGLHIVRKIMESHQGKIRLESENGKGTRAVLTFPAHLKVYETETHHFGYR
jgi:nitrogen fixation/metabolism regulation signal transduction histidine kinase